MILGNFVGLLFLFGVYSCADNGREYYAAKHDFADQSKRKFGIYVENGPRQGFQYSDSIGRVYDYRYFTETITNDSTIRIKLEISFSKFYYDKQLNDSLPSKVFLLPRDLTPDRQQFDKAMSKELYTFLNSGINKPVTLVKTLEPKEKCVVTIGVLTENSRHDVTTPYATGLIVTGYNPSALSLKFRLNSTLDMACGQIVYVPKQ